MKQSTMSNKRISAFMKRKLAQHPDLSTPAKRTIPVYQRGKLIDEITRFLDSGKRFAS